ncbi:T9SS type A sorting domain-containing protein [Cryomorphaceae bacterium 1068]|nr:T9SS type A sorting domain-containing protein [Cryomorphaceae bacterium 1068]
MLISSLTSVERFFFLFIFLIFAEIGQSQISEGFETGLPGSYTTGNVSLSSGSWEVRNVFRESSGNSRTGTAAARINDDIPNSYLTSPAQNGIGDIIFWYRELNSGGGTFEIQTSTDGVTFSTVATQAYSGQSYQQYSYSINNGSSNLQVRILSDDNPGHLIIDDLELSVFSGSSNPEPTNHPTLFSCTTFSDDQIDLTWTDAIGTDLPDGYLIKWSDVSYAAISNPTDLSDSNGPNSTTVNQGIESASISGLDPNTQYFFKIWSYSNSGSTIDYKTSPAAPQTDCTTDNGPICIAIQSFEVGDSWSYTASPVPYNVSGDVWDIEGSPFLGLNATDGTNLWAMQDLNNGNGGGSFRHELTFSNQNIAGYTAATISFDYKVFEFDGGDDLFYEVFEDGLSIGEVQLVDGTSNTSASGTVTVNLSPGTLTASIVIGAEQNGGGDYGIIDNVKICGIAPSCTPTHAITSILPTSGPAGTLVTISGSGFTGATAASLSGINATSITVIDDNTIIAEIPENATSGSIGVTVAGCETQSGQNFTLLVDDGDCGASGGGGSFASDLFISEVYDANSGSLSYVEIFNGTNATVNLATDNYVIRIRTGTSTDSDYPMTGNLASGDTYILRLGSSSSTCSNFSPDQDLPLAPGFNGDDRIYLRKNNADLDYAPNPNHPDAGGSGGSQPGFSQSRNGSVTSPSTTYMAADWTIGANEVCDDLGIAPFVPNGSDVTISTQPLDVDCSALTFSVTATADPIFNPTNPYVWRYNEPGTDTWELVSSLNGVNGLIVTGSGTSSITITGNTASLLDYQFYVDITADGTPDCTRSSNAAQYTYETRAFYRSNGSGDWTNVANWQMSDTEFGSYVAACQYPTESGSSKVNILSGDSIFLDNVAITIDELDVNSNGVLAIGEGGELFINNGEVSGADFTINGTYFDQASSPDGIEFNTDATWEIAPGATIIKTNTSSVSRYRDNYETGIVNIPATANWIYRREAVNEVSVASTDMYYPNLTFENNVGGNYTPGSNLYFFQGSSSRPVIYGNLNIGGSGTGGYTMITNNLNTDPILVNGELIIQAGSTLTNNDTGGSNEGTGIEVKGDLTVEGSLDFTSSTVAGRGQLVLSGNGDQLGIGDGNALSVNEFEINKPAGDFFTEFSLNVNREARFIDGIYEIDDLASNPADVEFSTSATAIGMSNASFVDGTVVKFGSADFDFPIGDTHADGGSFYQPLVMFGLTGTSGFSARYYAEEHPNAGLYYDGESNNINDFQEIGNCDYWRFEQVAGTADPIFGVRFTNSDPEYCNVVGAPEFIRISRWNGFSWDEIPSADNGTEIELDQAVGVAVGSDYGEFVLSGPEVGNSNVLPITLLSFQAEAKGQQVITDWITATEINNDFFSIERSKDGIFWEQVGTIEGAGDSHTELSYSLTDQRPYTGISYYRLRQTDFDGTSTLSEPQAVEVLSNGDFALDQVYHAQEGLNVIYHATAPFVTVEVFDLLGKRVHVESLENGGNGFGTIYPDLANGAYLLRLSNGQEMATEKFVW